VCTHTRPTYADAASHSIPSIASIMPLDATTPTPPTITMTENGEPSEAFKAKYGAVGKPKLIARAVARFDSADWAMRAQRERGARGGASVGDGGGATATTTTTEGAATGGV